MTAARACLDRLASNITVDIPIRDGLQKCGWVPDDDIDEALEVSFVTFC